MPTISGSAGHGVVTGPAEFQGARRSGQSFAGHWLNPIDGPGRLPGETTAVGIREVLLSNFLLVRGDDHLLLGVSWSGLAVAERRPDGMPVLRAADGARLTLTFPPQHLAEETASAGDPASPVMPSGAGTLVPVRRAALSGPSTIAFELEPGTTLVPTIDGILELLSRRRSAGAGNGTPGTAVELPWRLVFTLESTRPGDGVMAVHPVLPVTLDEASGLWRTCLMSTSAEPAVPGLAARDAAIALRAADAGAAGTADPPFLIPLRQASRQHISAAASREPAHASRLELSALGGTLTAQGRWENLEWEHEAVLGRDIRVRTLTSGVLYPLGHRAKYLEQTERVFDSEGNGVVLSSVFVLTITEPVREPPQEGPVSRAFPFGEVEITTLAYPDLLPADWQEFRPGLTTHFWPTGHDATGADARVRFPVRCATPDGDVRFALPLLFVADLSPGFASLTDPELAARLVADYGEVTIPLPGSQIDLVRAPRGGDPGSPDGHCESDVHEVHGITIGGNPHSSEHRPMLSALEVRLPALRSLLGEDLPRQVGFDREYLDTGLAAPTLLTLTEPIDVSFVGRTARSGGLVAPHFAANAISRALGPIDRDAVLDALGGEIAPDRLFPSDATLLGFALSELVTELKVPPQITSLLQPGKPPAAKMEWKEVRLQPHGPFRPVGQSTLDLTVTASGEGAETFCEVRGFALLLPSPSSPLLQLQFESLTFTQHAGRPPRLQVGGVDVKFLGELRLLQKLESVVDLGGLEPFIDVTPAGLVAHYSLPLDVVSSGAFVMQNFALNTQIAIPFDGRPVSVSLGFASRANPFTLAVLMFGGGGFLEVELDHSGLRRLEGALEFGAMMAVDFLIARGEVHALGGVRLELTADGSVSLTGYLRLGGCIEVLGLVSVSVELVISLAYRSDTNALVGRATMVIEVDLTLWSDSVELDSGEWVLAGGNPHSTEIHGTAEEALARWKAYRAAFVPSGGEH